MSDKKVQLNEEELKNVSGGSWADVVEWFKKKYEELQKKHNTFK